MPHRLKALFLALILAFCPLLSTSVSSAEERPAEVSRISQNLLDHLEKDKPGTVMAQVWIGDIDYDRVKEETFKRTNFDIDLLNKDFDAYKDEEIQHYIETKREVARELYEKNNVPFAEKYLKEFKIGYVCHYTPVILIYADWENVKLLESNEQVLWVDYYSTEGQELLATSLDATLGNYVKSLGYTGQGVKVGLMEAYYPDISRPATFMSPPEDVVCSDHATKCAWILAGNSSSSKGFCPDATLYCASQSIDGFYCGIEWMISKGVNLISCSMSHELDGQESSAYTTTSQWLDHLSFNHDVHFIQAAGNTPAKVKEEAIAYNVITVGGVDTRRTNPVSDDMMADFSGYNNTGINAMKPDLCAPAVSISILSYFPCSGTSYATPMVAGVVGQLCQKTPALKTQQGAMKAILTAGVNPASPIRYTPQNAGYKVSGAGFLDAKTAYSIVNRSQYVNSTIEKTVSYKSYTFAVSSTASPIRVSLAFQKTVRFSSGSHAGSTGGLLPPQVTNPLSDLDLFVYAPNGAMVGYSNTSRNNVEIVEFNPATYGTGTYRIEVSNYWSDATTYFGLAWS